MKRMSLSESLLTIGSFILVICGALAIGIWMISWAVHYQF